MPKILIVDDEKAILNVLQEALTKFGYEVAVAENGKEGIEKFDNDLFDLVITDMLMPGMNGDSVVRHIRNSNKQYTPVIGCSGTPWLLESSEVDMVLAKPCRLKEIDNAIQNLSATFPRQTPGKKAHGKIG